MNDEKMDVLHGAFHDELEDIAMEVKANGGRFSCHGQMDAARDCLKALRDMAMVSDSEARRHVVTAAR